MSHLRRPARDTRLISDASARFVHGATAALSKRYNLVGGELNEFSPATLMELARHSLALAGNDRKGLVDARMVADVALSGGRGGGAYMSAGAGMHSTSDFTDILANVASKAVLKGWEEAPETFDAWTMKGSVSDFKPNKRVDLNTFPSLEEVPEGAEYTMGTMGDRGATVQIASYGKIFAITRQAIINDDQQLFVTLPMRMGRAAKRTIGNLVYAVLTDNAAMADNIALFHEDHANLASSGAAPNVTTLDAGRVAMARQTDTEGQVLNIRPRYFLVPMELEGVASSLMASQWDPAYTQQVPSHVKGMAEVISDGRLTGNAWYLASNPQATDTIEVAYLNGESQPTVEQRDGWYVDGVEFKVRMDAGVAVLDHRGLYKNAGESE